MEVFETDITHDTGEAIKDVEHLVTSSARVQILKQLAEHGTLHRDELRERLDVTRTTLTRNLDTLESLGWIRNSGSKYSINICGRLVAEELERLMEATTLANRLQEVLQWVPESSLDIDLHYFRGATVLTPEPGDPYSMINDHVDLLRNTEYCRALLRVTGLHATEAAHEAIVKKGGRAELVVTPEVADIFTKKPRYASLIDEISATGRFNLYVHDGAIPFSLMIMDDTIQIGVDEDGDPRGLIEVSSEEVKCWAEDRYKDYRQRSEPLF